MESGARVHMGRSTGHPRSVARGWHRARTVALTQLEAWLEKGAARGGTLRRGAVK